MPQGRMMRAGFLIAGFAAFLAAQNPPESLTAAQKGRLAALLPSARELAARSASGPKFYFADLYRYIDGGAEAYLRRGFVALVHREYKTSAIELTVDIYDMGNPAGAAAICAAERSPESPAAAAGAEAFSGDGMLNFRQGRYYGKLLAFGDPGKSAPLLERAARAIAAKIGKQP
jgi:hypothetical protein